MTAPLPVPYTPAQLDDFHHALADAIVAGLKNGWLDAVAEFPAACMRRCMVSR